MKFGFGRLKLITHSVGIIKVIDKEVSKVFKVILPIHCFKLF